MPAWQVAVSSLEHPRLDPARLQARTMSATVVVAQTRSAVVDLFGALGLGLEESREAFTGTVHG